MDATLEWQRGHFSTFGWGLSLRRECHVDWFAAEVAFLHLWVGTFIEVGHAFPTKTSSPHFPSLLEGLSLRLRRGGYVSGSVGRFLHLWVGTFIEG